MTNVAQVRLMRRGRRVRPDAGLRERGASIRILIFRISSKS